MSERIDTQILIQAPPARAWAVLTDFAAYGRWNSYIVSVEGPLHDGASLTVQTRYRSDCDDITTATVKLASAQYPAMLWEGGHEDRSIFRGAHHFEIVPDRGGATLFRHFELFSGHAAPAMLARHRDFIEGNFQRFNTDFKARCEALE